MALFGTIIYTPMVTLYMTVFFTGLALESKGGEGQGVGFPRDQLRQIAHRDGSGEGVVGEAPLEPSASVTPTVPAGPAS